MTISTVRSFLMSYPFSKPIQLPFYGGLRTILKRDAMLIRIEGEKGLVGYAPGQGSEKAQRAIETMIGPFLEGKTLGDVDKLRAEFFALPGVDLELQKIYCSVEVAVYDLAARERGAPLSEAVGGRVRDRIKLYGSAGMYMAPDRYAEEAAAIAGMGFRAYKMRPAAGPEKDIETVRLMREAVGPEVGLMIDAHAWWRMGDRNYAPETVEQVAREMAKYGITWLEEPLPPDDHAAYQRLREKRIVPLASGEHEPSEPRFLDLIQNRCVDYVQSDVCCQGGFAMGQRLFAEIQKAGLKFAFHSWGTALEVIAAAQVGICWPETVVEWLEYPVYSTPEQETMYEFPLATELLEAPLQVEGSELVVPRSPGMGVEVDMSVLDRYPWIPGPWSFFYLDSPKQTLAVTSDHSVKWETPAA